MDRVPHPPTVGGVDVGVGPVSFQDLWALAREGAPVRLTDEALAAIARARDVVEALAASATPVYGVSTALCLERYSISIPSPTSSAKVEKNSSSWPGRKRPSTWAVARPGITLTL